MGWGTRADNNLSLFGMPKMEKRAKETSRELGQQGISWQPRPERRLLGSFIGKRAGSWANTKVLERYTGW